MDDPKCANCGKDASNRCSRCKSEWYCGKDCQKISWKKHKEFCQKLADLYKETEAFDNEKKNKNTAINKTLKEEGLDIKNNKIEVKKENVESKVISIPEKKDEKEEKKETFKRELDELD